MMKQIKNQKKVLIKKERGETVCEKKDEDEGTGVSTKRWCLVAELVEMITDCRVTRTTCVLPKQ